VLEIRQLLGENEEVFAETERLRAEMAGYPDPPTAPETVLPWNVREGLLHTARGAAAALEQWEQARSLVDETVACQLLRGALELEVASTRMNASGPLISLGLLDEGRQLLEECRGVFEQYDDFARLGRCLSTLAQLEHRVAHGDRAVELQRIGIRLLYRTRDPRDLAGVHRALASYLPRWSDDSTPKAPSLNAWRQRSSIA
jgi:hypothetical protein